MSIDVIEGRIASLQAGLDAIANGAPPPSSSAATFADLLASQSTDGSDTAADDTSAALSSDGSSSDLDSLSSLAGTSDTSSTDGVDDTGTSTGSTVPTGPTGQDVVADAKKYLGVPYLWGGTDPAKGLDCSGLVQRVMKDLGVTMPRTVRDQRNVGTEVSSMASAKPGDLLVFGSHHIGIYLGNGKMLHAPHTGDHVRISDVYETPTRIRRVLPSGSSSSLTGTTVGDVRPASLRQSGSSDTSHRYDALFERATRTYKLPSGLLRSVASVESSFRAGAVSPAGAKGLMQLMPGTAKSLGVDPMDPAQAVDGAARLLSGLVHQFGSVKLALAAYNAGPGAVHKYGGVPPYPETQAYVRKVMSTMEAQ
jgi:cell wall-associated NlpC family hydrolase